MGRDGEGEWWAHFRLIPRTYSLGSTFFTWTTPFSLNSWRMSSSEAEKGNGRSQSIWVVSRSPVFEPSFNLVSFSPVSCQRKTKRGLDANLLG